MYFGPFVYVTGDVVEFRFKNQLIVGTIVVSDYGGAVGYSSNTYDISVQDVLYKHVEEKFIVRIIKKTDRLINRKKRIEMALGLLEDIEKECLEKLRRNQEFVALNKNIKFGKYLFFTESGSKYSIQFGENEMFMIRKNKQYELCKDGQNIRILFLDVRIGLPAFFILESLGDEYPIFQTTRVIEIKKV